MPAPAARTTVFHACTYARLLLGTTSRRGEIRIILVRTKRQSTPRSFSFSFFQHEILYTRSGRVLLLFTIPETGVLRTDHKILPRAVSSQARGTPARNTTEHRHRRGNDINTAELCLRLFIGTTLSARQCRGDVYSSSIDRYLTVG